MSLKNIFVQNLLSFLKENLTPILLTLIENGGEHIVRDILEYYIYKGNIDNPEQFTSYITQELSKEIGDEMATLAEQWEARGYNKGINEGMEKGIETGMERGMERGIEKMARDIARKLLAQGKSIEDVAQITNLPLPVVIAMQNHVQDTVS